MELLEMSLRIEKTDETYIRSRLESARNWSARHAALLQSQTDVGREQVLYTDLAMDQLNCACCMYALGESFDEVIAEFGKASLSWVEVFRRRGKLTLPPPGDIDIPGAPNPFPKGTKPRVDYSLTNSRTNRLASYTALLAREYARAREISSQAWDPPNDYVQKGPGFCTPNDQRMAFALKHLMCDEHAMIEKEVLNVRVKPTSHVYWEIEMMRATRDGDSDLVVEAFEYARKYHSRFRQRNSVKNDTFDFLCIPACGLLSYAIEVGVVGDTDLESIEDDCQLELVYAVTGHD